MLSEIEQVLPSEIEKRSFEIITEELKEMGKILCPETELIVKRCIHTSADFDYAKNLCFSENAVEKAIQAIKDGACIAAYKDTSGYTGSKTISISQMPRHNHPLVNNLGCGWNGTNATTDRLYYGRYHSGRILREFGDSALTGEGKDYIPYSYACKVWVRTA